MSKTLPVKDQGVDGKISKEIARRYQEDLSAYVKSAEATELIMERESLYSGLWKMKDIPEMTARFQEMLANQNDFYHESFVRDFIEFTQKNGNRIGFPTVLSGADVNLATVEELALKRTVELKNRIFELNPELKEFLESSERLQKLLEANDFVAIEKTLKAYLPNSSRLDGTKLTNKIISEVKKGELTPQRIEFIENLIRLGDPTFIGNFVNAIDWQAKFDIPAIARAIIESSTPSSRFGILAKNFFKRVDTDESRRLMEMGIRKSEDFTKVLLIQVFGESPARAAGLENELVLAIQIYGKSPEFARRVIDHVLVKDANFLLSRAVKFLIVEGGEAERKYLAQNVRYPMPDEYLRALSMDKRDDRLIALGLSETSSAECRNLLKPPAPVLSGTS